MIYFKDLFVTITTIRRDYFKDLMSETGLTYMDIDILQFLSDNPDFNTMTNIITAKSFTKSHVSASIKGMIEKGYLTRSVMPENKKIVKLTLLPKSDAVIKKSQDCRLNFRRVAFSDISQDELEKAGDIITRIASNLKKEKERR